jgi:hypothetical protein
MKLTELQGTLLTKERKINHINIIKSKIESKLHGLKARTETIDNLITFETIKIPINSGRGYQSSNIKLLRIYKDGYIDIEKLRNSIQINWSVKLIDLYFISLCFSAILGVVVLFTTDVESIFVIASTIAFFLTFVFLGILYIKYKLTDLIESCVYPNYN